MYKTLLPLHFPFLKTYFSIFIWINFVLIYLDHSTTKRNKNGNNSIKITSIKISIAISSYSGSVWILFHFVHLKKPFFPQFPSLLNDLIPIAQKCSGSFVAVNAPPLETSWIGKLLNITQITRFSLLSVVLLLKLHCGAICSYFFVMANILAPMCPKHPPCPAMHYSRLWELGRGAIERK